MDKKTRVMLDELDEMSRYARDRSRDDPRPEMGEITRRPWA